LTRAALCPFQECFICRERGAVITCAELCCDLSFHLPCGPQGACVTQYFPPYSSFCWQHRPQQAVEVAPQNTACLLCLEPLEDSDSYSTMVCPVCQHAWFHRRCIQGQALRAGISCFQCPLCRDGEEFLLEMVTMGIRIPLRLPAWETSDDYTTLTQRHSRCDASKCLCPGGREQADEVAGPWQLLLCSSCAAVGTHRRCFNLAKSMASWECGSCAGHSTGKRQ
ncbi:G2E3 ligase, partial [Bucorvus abyssinicus]|nr:G2E3 ligase [Bucorvus abyssinicus]